MTTAVLEVAAAPQAAPSPPNLTVRDLKDGAFARAKAEFKNPADAIEILNYIDFLAQNNSMSADDLALPFKSGEMNEWKLTRAEATQLFFGHLEAKAEAIKASIVLPDKAAEAAISQAMKERAVVLKQNFEQNIKDDIRQAEAYLSEMNKYLIQARRKREELEALEGGVDYEKKIKEITEGLASTNWNFHRFANSTIEFVSRSDIMLRHIDNKAGLHYELNCGRYRLAIRLDQMVPKLYAHERCVPNQAPGIHSNIHPHVSTQAEICFGNASDSYREAQLQGDILKMMRIIDALLPNYGDQPFVSIVNFKKAIDERDRRERENYGKKKEKAAGGIDVEDDLLDDEPEFNDDLEWSDGNDDDNDNDE